MLQNWYTHPYETVTTEAEPETCKGHKLTVPNVRGVDLRKKNSSQTSRQILRYDTRPAPFFYAFTEIGHIRHAPGVTASGSGWLSIRNLKQVLSDNKVLNTQINLVTKH